MTTRYAPLHPTSSWTCQRPAADVEPGGMERPTLSTIATVTAGVEDVTADLRREFTGRAIDLGLRLWLSDATTTYRPADLWSGTYRGQSVALECVRCEGPFGTGDWDHQEIYLASPVASRKLAA